MSRRQDPTAGRDDRNEMLPNRAETKAHQPWFTLLTGDATEVLQTLSTASVNCVVTSPPYWRMRDYSTGTWTGGSADCTHSTDEIVTTAPRSCARCGASWTDAQYGLEPTPTAYIEHLRQVFDEIRRVLSPTGTLWLNLGDNYSTNSDGYRCARPGQYRQPRYRPPADLPHKNLVGMPWRVALALQADGWLLRNAVVWHKPNTTPFPTRDRLTCQYEMLFLLVQRERYFFDLDAIRQSYAGDRSLSRRAHLGGNKPHTARGTWPPAGMAGQDSPAVRGRNPGDMWTIPVTPRRNQPHPAVSPLEVPLRCIAAGCPPHGVVLDCFSGTGTTGLAALQLGRSYVGIDLNPGFHDLARERFSRITRLEGRSGGPAAEHSEAA